MSVVRMSHRPVRFGPCRSGDVDGALPYAQLTQIVVCRLFTVFFLVFISPGGWIISVKLGRQREVSPVEWPAPSVVGPVRNVVAIEVGGICKVTEEALNNIYTQTYSQWVLCATMNNPLLVKRNLVLSTHPPYHHNNKCNLQILPK